MNREIYELAALKIESWRERLHPILPNDRELIDLVCDGALDNANDGEPYDIEMSDAQLIEFLNEQRDHEKGQS